MEHSKYFRGQNPIQHTREYAPFEVSELLRMTGFEVDRMETFQYFAEEKLGPFEHAMVGLCCIYNALKLRHPKHVSPKFRRPHLAIVARKSSAPSERYPTFLYAEI